MGWTFQSMPSEGAKAHCDAILTYKGQAIECRVLDSAIVRRNEYYAAVETIKPDGARQVWAAVFMLNFCPKARDGYTFGYKDMSESMGPYLWNCPARILDLLTTEGANNYAIDWREKCRATIAARNAKPKLTHGAILQIENAPMYCGIRLERVQVIRRPGSKRPLFRAPNTGHFYWPSIRQYNYSLSTNQEGF